MAEWQPQLWLHRLRPLCPRHGKAPPALAGDLNARTRRRVGEIGRPLEDADSPVERLLGPVA